jgi:hypothetical protein
MIPAEANMKSERLRDIEKHPEQSIIWGEVEAQLTPEQDAELDRRIAEDEAQPEDVIPLERVVAEMKARLK